MRVYRYLPFLVLMTFLQALFVVAMVHQVVVAVRHTDIGSVCVAVALVGLLLPATVGIGLFRRHRTVIDAAGVTQHWILNSYRMPFDEITAVNEVHTYGRWHLRVRCRERSYEVMPCILTLNGIGSLRPPRALTEVSAEIGRARANM